MSGVDVIGNGSKFKTKSNKALGSLWKKLQQYDSAIFFAGLVLLNPNGVWQLAT